MHAMPVPVAIVFATSVRPDANAPGRELAFSVDTPLRTRHVRVFELATGKLHDVTLELVEDTRNSPACGVSSLCGPGDGYVLYSGTLPPGPDAGENDVVVILKPATVRSVALRASQLRELSQLKSKWFASIESIDGNGIDGDRDGRPDVAFVHVCIEYPRGDSICGEEAVVAARRAGRRWRLTNECAGNGCPGMLVE